MRWLATPDLMARWILGAQRVETDGARLRLELAMGKHASAFAGETVEHSLRRLVRRYALDGHPAYTRTVSYELAPTLEGCEVVCAVITDIDGFPAAAIRPAQRAELRSLERSLERLRLGVAGRRSGLWRRARDGNLTVQAL